MAKARILAAAGAFVLIGAATGAHAETAKPRAPSDAFTVRGDFNAQAAASQQNKIIQWDAKKGRWGLKLDLGRDTQWKDVVAGAYFRVTPSLRVGGAVGLEQQDGPVRKRDAEETAPKVRLETAFKF